MSVYKKKFISSLIAILKSMNLQKDLKYKANSFKTLMMMIGLELNSIKAKFKKLNYFKRER
jgi:hypothetical protein